MSPLPSRVVVLVGLVLALPAAHAQSPPPDGFAPGINGTVHALALQGDGKLIIGGEFTSVGGLPRTNLARLNADGSVDGSFITYAGGPVYALAVQADGRCLAGGNFMEAAWARRDNLARLQEDGSLDRSFGGRTDGTVRALALQPDGRIIVGGDFDTLDYEWCMGFGRLTPDGTKEPGFSSTVQPGAVYAVAVQPDGKLLMGGTFGSQIVGLWRYRLARWNADGTLDQGFSPGEFSHNSASVDALAVQPDGRILVGGTFTNLAGRACYRIGRLTAGGALENSFGSGADDRVNAFALQADGKIIAAGRFTMMSGQPRSRLVRFNADGTLDASFNAGADNAVGGLALQADGRLLVAGAFTNLAGQSRSNLARLAPGTAPVQSLQRSGADVLWVRDGGSPEVWRTAFDWTTNGMSWTALGAGSLLGGSWQITGIAAPANATLRAQGFAVGGFGDGSASVLEEFHGPPVVLAQPASQRTNAGTVATFSLRGAGSTPLSLQWCKDGLALVDGGRFGGARTSALTLTNLQRADTGAYSVVLSNAFGSVTSAVAVLTVLDPGIAAQPRSLNREFGQTATFSVSPAGTGPFTYQWCKDGVPLAGATADALQLTNLLANDAARYTVLVANPLGSITSAPALLTVNTALLDAGFDPGGGDQNAVYAVTVQPDGRIMAGGSFYQLGGQVRGQIARLNADGSADLSFNPGSDGLVTALASLTDRSTLAAGSFWYLGGVNLSHVGRLLPNGATDVAFTNGGNSSIYAIAMQPDRAVLFGGLFTSFGGQPRNYIARLNPDGSLDATFNPGADYIVSALAVQPDGKIVVGGMFTLLHGQPRASLARLYPDGSLDPDFAPVVEGDGVTLPVTTLALQTDGKILVGGTFSAVNGQPRGNIARLNPDGGLDDTFTAGVSHENLWLTPSVSSILVQTDGKILLGGMFTEVAGESRMAVARLMADGSLDLGFNPLVGGSLPYLYAVTAQSDGRILVGGCFLTVNGQPRTNLARLLNPGTVTDTLSRNGSTLVWLRGGPGPEVAHTTFEHTSDGYNWTALGAGTRIPGGWRLTGMALPVGGTVRVRGFLAAGRFNSSLGYVETLLGAPVFITQPLSLTNNAGTGASFSLLATGPAPLTYQWFKDDVPLNDGAGVSGANTDTLDLASVFKAAEGSYRLVVTNPSGSVTSQVATLTVIDPVLTMSPVSRYAEVGQSVTFSVGAAGTALSYQWWKDGSAVALATASALTLTNVQVGDAGGYRAVVSNPFGSVTSALATLTVNLAGLDTNFTPIANNSVSAIALQGDGRILLGGNFTSLAGSTRLRLGRLNTNGTLDSAFNPQPNATVYALAVQPDGKILVGGDFTSVAAASRMALARLNTNGTLDTNFTTTVFNPPQGYTLTARVQAIVLQADGNILVGGRSSLNGGIANGFIYRLLANGANDTNFVNSGGANGPVTTLALQPDGKVVVGGLFTWLRTMTHLRLGRLLANGNVDVTFNPSADNTVLSLALQTDGRILVGGNFTAISSQARTNLARLNPDGTVDTSFAPNVLGGSTAGVYSLALQASGQVVIGGGFTTVAGQPRANLARLNADGSLEAGLNPGPNNVVYGVAIQPDGRIVVGGDFTVLGSQTRNRVGRLNPPEAAAQALTYDGAKLTWQRGGSSPEVSRAAFEFSTNLVTWTTLGTGTRMAGGWELGGLALLPAGRVRVRGYAAGGGFNASSWFVDSTLGVDPNAPPRFVVDDSSPGFGSGQFGFNLAGLIGQRVTVEGSTDLTHWLPLATNTLTTTPFFFSDPSATNFPARYYRAWLR